MFDNGVLKQILGPKKEVGTGGSWKLHNEAVHYLHSSPNVMRLIKSNTRRWTGLVSSMGEKKNAYKGLVGKAEGERTLGRLRSRWDYNITKYIKLLGWRYKFYSPGS